MRAALLLAACAPLCACALVGAEDRAPADARGEDNLDVVGDAGEFDPAQAVDDRDAAPREASYRPEKALEDVEHAVDARLPDDERVASDAEADALERARAAGRAEAEERAQEGGVDDDETAAALASNPPPEEPRGEGVAWSAVDLALEGLLVAAAALALTLLAAFARTHKRSVAAAVALGAAALGAIAWEIG